MAYPPIKTLPTAILALLLVATPGCGDDNNGVSTPQVDSNLLGVYAVNQFQNSEDCTELMDADGAPRLVLYSSTLSDEPDRAIMVGQFCGSVEDCQARAEAGSAAVNYSFFEGNDTEGWLGYGIASQGFVGDECLVEVQVHTLTSTSGQTIEIDTEQVETRYDSTPASEGQGTCSILDAIESITDESPCTALFFIEATFEASL